MGGKLMRRSAFSIVVVSGVLFAHSAAAEQLVRRTIALTGEAAPGMAEGVYFSSLANGVIDEQGNVRFQADLEGPGISSNSESSFWQYNGQSNQLLHQRTVTRLDGNGPVVSAPGPVAAFAAGQTLSVSEAIIDDRGVSVLWLGNPDDGLATVATVGGTLPGMGANETITSLPKEVDLNNHGIMAFKSFLSDSEPDGESLTAQEILWLGTPDELTVVARSGQSPPGFPDDVVFAESAHRSATPFNSPRINDAGQISFRGIIEGPGIDAFNEQVL